MSGGGSVSGRARAVVVGRSVVLAADKDIESMPQVLADLSVSRSRDLSFITFQMLQYFLAG